MPIEPEELTEALRQFGKCPEDKLPSNAITLWRQIVAGVQRVIDHLDLGCLLSDGPHNAGHHSRESMMFGSKPIVINIDKVIILPPQLSPTAEELLGEVLEKVKKLMSTSEDLVREVQETKDAVSSLVGRLQSKIDQMQSHIDELQTALDNGDTEAARNAVTALDSLQTEMAGIAVVPETPASAETPAEELPVEETPAEDEPE